MDKKISTPNGTVLCLTFLTLFPAFAGRPKKSLDNNIAAMTVDRTDNDKLESDNKSRQSAATCFQEWMLTSLKTNIKRMIIKISRFAPKKKEEVNSLFQSFAPKNYNILILTLSSLSAGNDREKINLKTAFERVRGKLESTQIIFSKCKRECQSFLRERLANFHFSTSVFSNNIAEIIKKSEMLSLSLFKDKITEINKNFEKLRKSETDFAETLPSLFYFY
ncbi:MAG: hypothetical protein LBR09_03030 [Endomicrobium sp.]|nr:hypothetical protein [Endomicrobium sp.]